MDRSAFALNLQRAIVATLAEFRRQVPDETPYAFALILGQGPDLAYAIATEEGLSRVAGRYAALAYRYRGFVWADAEALTEPRLRLWLRWSNPDDGWTSGEFAAEFGIGSDLDALVAAGAFGPDAAGLEEFGTKVLTALETDGAWRAIPPASRPIVGVTSGEDPDDFLRTATRANPYSVVTRLWVEVGQGREVESRIRRPGDPD